MDEIELTAEELISLIENKTVTIIDNRNSKINYRIDYTGGDELEVTAIDHENKILEEGFLILSSCSIYGQLHYDI